MPQQQQPLVQDVFSHPSRAGGDLAAAAWESCQIPPTMSVDEGLMETSGLRGGNSGGRVHKYSQETKAKNREAQRRRVSGDLALI
jgi:hypothetical protein